MSKYFEFKRDFEKIKKPSSSKSKKILIGGKILLKGAANLGIFAITEMPVAMAKQILKMENATEEQKERAREIIRKHENK